MIPAVTIVSVCEDTSAPEQVGPTNSLYVTVPRAVALFVPVKLVTESVRDLPTFIVVVLGVVTINVGVPITVTGALQRLVAG